MISIRSGKGIGDNIYLQSIARHLVECGHELEICTDWPDIFRPIAGKVKFSPHRRDRIDRVSHYTTRKNIKDTDQFQDCCITAGVPPTIDLRLDWLASGGWYSERPAILVQMPREPFGRRDGYAMDLLPDCRRLQRAIDLIGNRAFIVQVGSGTPLFKFSGIDLDLVGKTSIAQLMDAGFSASGLLGYCSFFVPLAETFSKPALFVWSSRGLRSRNEYVRTITPRKILHRASSRYVTDDCSELELSEAVNSFLEEVGSRSVFQGQAGCDRRQRTGSIG